MDINRAWESIRKNVKAAAKDSPGYYELKQHKPWSEEESSKLLDQWLHNPSQVNGNYPYNIRCETSSTFRNKNMGHNLHNLHASPSIVKVI